MLPVRHKALIGTQRLQTTRRLVMLEPPPCDPIGRDAEGREQLQHGAIPRCLCSVATIARPPFWNGEELALIDDWRSSAEWKSEVQDLRIGLF